MRQINLFSMGKHQKTTSAVDWWRASLKLFEDKAIPSAILRNVLTLKQRSHGTHCRMRMRFE